MKPMFLLLIALLACNASLAQGPTAVKEGAKATEEKARGVGNQAKGAISTQPRKATNDGKASVHKAKAHVHAQNAKNAAKEVPKQSSRQNVWILFARGVLDTGRPHSDRRCNRRNPWDAQQWSLRSQ
jgi:hypothetical protein